ncbi:hybrid sensor histidine kinase/response regulator [Fluviispira multicolorata]|uniref:histidine kinase n=1 Tax=Fluviispira multicolorata TaxID=2654512 RepID=A0A833JDC5_9BACT|nr:hybrid sensor histidine kinase/response regulator [Fluviispira multicolorata]KAB8031798.1 response regulator [Fluviispira multicolorata]
MDDAKLNILVIEDDEYISKVITKEFTALNYATHTISTISEAKEYINEKAHLINLFLLDIKLPDGDGLSLLDTIKQKNQEAAIIIMSGHLNNKIVNRAIRNGCYNFLEKPFSVEKDIVPIVKRSLSSILLKKENNYLSEQMLHTSKLTALGELSATIVHDIRGPLGIIQLTCEDLNEDFLQKNNLSKEELEEHLSQIFKACGKIKKLVDHLRNYSRNDHSEKEESINVYSLIENSLFMVKQKIRNFNIKVIHEEDITLSKIEIKCYPNKFEQVLMNLMSNACDAMKEQEKKELSIKVFINQGFLYISVCDTGSGIPENIQTKIFESFFTTKPKGEGTGLGLSIVKNIVMEHGGELLLESEMGVGSIFTVKLPTTKILSEDDSSKSPPPSKAA